MPGFATSNTPFPVCLPEQRPWARRENRRTQWVFCFSLSVHFSFTSCAVVQLETRPSVKNASEPPLWCVWSTSLVSPSIPKSIVFKHVNWGHIEIYIYIYIWCECKIHMWVMSVVCLQRAGKDFWTLLTLRIIYLALTLWQTLPGWLCA